MAGVTVSAEASTRITAPAVPVSVTVYGRREYLRR